ncbi:MAG: ABC-F family ATP-binding cassette domain-containing protein [Ruminococcaceae bacterium]|nr:ABC-F family ATP-binding cassette domain-containing protein [Oscillospiraceae bacterium]
MIAIGCESVSLSYGTEIILDKVTFSINEGERLGIVGVNGAGKTTLIKIFSGEYSSDEGNIYISKNLRLGVLKQHIEYESDKNIYDALADEFVPPRVNDVNAIEQAKGEYISRVKGFLKNLGFSDGEIHGLPVSALSGGQKTRIALASVLLKNYDILMLDEPTNHLDISSLDWLEEYLKNSGKTVLIISHDRYFLDKVTTKTLEIENHKGKLYNGNYTFYANQKKKDREVQEKHYKDQQKEIARIEAYIANQRKWNRERNIIAAESREKQLKKMERVEKVSALPEKIKLSFASAGRSGDDVLSVRKVGKRYGERELFSDVSFELKYQDKAFLFGNNGCGKSTLIKIIAGRIPADNGVVDIGYNVHCAYYDQENQDLDTSNTVMDELWNVNDSLSPGEIRAILARFLFTGEDCFKEVSVLSGGERARLTLAKLIMSKNNFLILDEPTNHLDINSREALESALEDFDGTILAVSHDRYFIDKLSTRMLVFNAVDQNRVFDYKGGYSEYLEYKEKYLIANETQETVKAETASKAEYNRKKEEQSNKRKFAHKIEVAKREVRSIEARIQEIDEECNGPAATDHKRLAELFEKRNQIEAKLLEHYEFLMEIGEEV